MKPMKPTQPGRDGQEQAVTRVWVTTADEDGRIVQNLELFDARHPIEQMWRKGSLDTIMALDGEHKDPEQGKLRYCAARLWSEHYDMASGKTDYNAGLSERVDTSRRRGSPIETLVDKYRPRLECYDKKVLTEIQWDVLDAIAGQGFTMTECAKQRGRDRKTVRKAFLTGLDRLVKFYPYDEMSRVTTLKATR